MSNNSIVKLRPKSTERVVGFLSAHEDELERVAIIGLTKDGEHLIAYTETSVSSLLGDLEILKADILNGGSQ
ncbi:hypothetical protein LCGC14_0147220 [marine sediment metagenome]|uniref:Uncharacterized protein n=1 Tax=marine sediment metagenome TaxID=412755 RepID=A0A0F9V062_9ZZZZ